MQFSDGIQNSKKNQGSGLISKRAAQILFIK